MPEYIELSSLFLLDFNRVTIRVSDHECSAEPGLIRNHARRSRLDFRGIYPAARGIGIVSHQHGLAVGQVIGMFIGGERPAVARREVFQELNSRAASAAQCCDAQACAKHIVRVLLLGPVVFSLSPATLMPRRSR
jgi:hypothetical protein